MQLLFTPKFGVHLILLSYICIRIYSVSKGAKQPKNNNGTVFRAEVKPQLQHLEGSLHQYGVLNALSVHGLSIVVFLLHVAFRFPAAEDAAQKTNDIQVPIVK
jgi:hypothetical protein